MIDLISGAVPRKARSLYIHIPFCISRCIYCDFNSRGPASGSCHNPALLRSYADAILWEAERYAQEGAGQAGGLTTCFMGGGTPTVLGDAELRDIIAGVGSAFGFARGYELTVEANPGTLSPSRLDNLLSAGANRLSLGVQSFNDDELAMLGRIHSAREALETVDQAKRSGFVNISLDLMFGLPGQNMEVWADTLKRGVDADPSHISAYCLTVEDGTPLKDALDSGRLPSIDDDSAADMMEFTMGFLRDNGFHQYEISNYAKPGCECVHNRTYWEYLPYIGLGAGAVGFSGTARYTDLLHDAEYLDAVGRGILPIGSVEDLDAGDLMAESCFMGMRLLEGLDAVEWQRRFGIPLSGVYGESITDLLAKGLVEWAGDRLRLSRSGIMVGNEVFSAFLLS